MAALPSWDYSQAKLPVPESMSPALAANHRLCPGLSQPLSSLDPSLPPGISERELSRSHHVHHSLPTFLTSPDDGHIQGWHASSSHTHTLEKTALKFVWDQVDPERTQVNQLKTTEPQVGITLPPQSLPAPHQDKPRGQTLSPLSPYPSTLFSSRNNLLDKDPTEMVAGKLAIQPRHLLQQCQAQSTQ